MHILPVGELRDYRVWSPLRRSTGEHPAHEERVGHDSKGMKYKKQQSTDSIYLWKQNDTAMGMVIKLNICVIWNKLLNLVEPQFPHL